MESYDQRKIGYSLIWTDERTARGWGSDIKSWSESQLCDSYCRSGSVSDRQSVTIFELIKHVHHGVSTNQIENQWNELNWNEFTNSIQLYMHGSNMVMSGSRTTSMGRLRESGPEWTGFCVQNKVKGTAALPWNSKTAMVPKTQMWLRLRFRHHRPPRFG